MSDRPRIQLALTLEEINVLLDALGRLPYTAVFTVIERIRDQARAQLQAPPAEGDEP
jgi:hypothetical protein